MTAQGTPWVFVSVFVPPRRPRDEDGQFLSGAGVELHAGRGRRQLALPGELVPCSRSILANIRGIIAIAPTPSALFSGTGCGGHSRSGRPGTNLRRGRPCGPDEIKGSSPVGVGVCLAQGRAATANNFDGERVTGRTGPASLAWAVTEGLSGGKAVDFKPRRGIVNIHEFGTGLRRRSPPA